MPFEEPQTEDRAAKRAMMHGWRRKCPKCGSGTLMRGYLTVRDRCPVCGEELHHHRADDGPAYLTILIVGHVMARSFLWTYTAYTPEPLVMASIFSVGCVALFPIPLAKAKGADRGAAMGQANARVWSRALAFEISQFRTDDRCLLFLELQSRERQLDKTQIRHAGDGDPGAGRGQQAKGAYGPTRREGGLYAE